jgi:hypothetical protein
VRWRLEFYSERRRTLARYSVEAPTPAAAQVQGFRGLLAEYAPAPAPRWPSLFERAQRLSGLDAGEWALYRIANDQ